MADLTHVLPPLSAPPLLSPLPSSTPKPIPIFKPKKLLGHKIASAPHLCSQDAIGFGVATKRLKGGDSKSPVL
jgi:hypothetical protein